MIEQTKIEHFMDKYLNIYYLFVSNKIIFLLLKFEIQPCLPKLCNHYRLKFYRV